MSSWVTNRSNHKQIMREVYILISWNPQEMVKQLARHQPVRSFDMSIKRVTENTQWKTFPIILSISRYDYIKHRPTTEVPLEIRIVTLIHIQDRNTPETIQNSLCFMDFHLHMHHHHHENPVPVGFFHTTPFSHHVLCEQHSISYSPWQQPQKKEVSRLPLS